MSSVIYKVREHYQFDDKDAERLMPELETYAGKTDSEVVLAVKDKKGSEIRKELTWDDKIAGHVFRCQQVQILRRAFIRIRVEEEHNITEPGFVRIRAKALDQKDVRVNGHHQPVTVAVLPERLKEAGISLAAMKQEESIRQLISWVRRFAPWREEFTDERLERVFLIAAELEEPAEAGVAA